MRKINVAKKAADTISVYTFLAYMILKKCTLRRSLYMPNSWMCGMCGVLVWKGDSIFVSFSCLIHGVFPFLSSSSSLPFRLRIWEWAKPLLCHIWRKGKEKKKCRREGKNVEFMWEDRRDSHFGKLVCWGRERGIACVRRLCMMTLSPLSLGNKNILCTKTCSGDKLREKNLRSQGNYKAEVKEK